MIEKLFIPNDFLVNNLELYFMYLKFFIVISVSIYIFIKSQELYKLSNYKGLRIFGLAFFFFGFAYSINFIIYILSLHLKPYDFSLLFLIIRFLFYYSISMAPLMLVYSMVWKDIENNLLCENLVLNKILQEKYLLLNFTGIIIGIISLYEVEVMFIISLILLSYAIIISYSNYIKNKILNDKIIFSQLYFITMILAFIGYLVNFLLGFFPVIKFYEHIIMIIIFLIFFYGTLKYRD